MSAQLDRAGNLMPLLVVAERHAYLSVIPSSIGSPSHWLVQHCSYAAACFVLPEERVACTMCTLWLCMPAITAAVPKQSTWSETRESDGMPRTHLVIIKASQEAGQHEVLLHHHDEGSFASCCSLRLQQRVSHLHTAKELCLAAWNASSGDAEHNTHCNGSSACKLLLLKA